MAATLRLAVLQIIFCLLCTDAAAVVPSGASDVETTSLDVATVGQFCMTSSDCNEWLYERCSSAKVCICDTEQMAFYDNLLQRCNPCPNELQRCEHCCSPFSHTCVEGSCVEDMWWVSPPPQQPQPPQVRPFTIAIAMIAALSILLFVWHCCCAKDRHKPPAESTPNGLAAGQSTAIELTTRPESDQTPSSTFSLPRPPPPRFSSIETPPPSYTEAIKVAQSDDKTQ